MPRAKLKEQKRDATEARLAGMTLPDSAGWLRDARNAALARVTDMGLPHPRDEYWKFTNPRTLTDSEVPAAAVLEDDEAEIFDGIESLKIVFVDGVFDADASDDLSLEGIEIDRLANAAGTDIHWAKDLYGVLEAKSHGRTDRPLAALNTAFATDGVVIRVTGKPSKPVRLVYLHKSETSDAFLHHCVKVEKGAELSILESGPGAARFSSGMEIDIADEGAFHLVRSQGRDHERRAVTGTFARLGRESTFKTFTMTVNGVLTRNEAVVEINGDDATAHIAGTCLGDGKDFHHDDTVFITHDAVNCESRQVFKKVLRNGATGVFQGKILVQPGAQKTDGYQISQSLLLDENATFLAKPELEIYADDVACSHGSTSGAIDREAMFYLRSRGVGERQATNLLTIAFVAEALAEIENPVFAEALQERLEGWLSRRYG
ncbi:SufB/SufD family protein [Pelagovum pacificum]|uniref:Fe-S cluster assembly protein SufD n=1 Tax=Pelagovum pacificum TaxID=2588711 RepID=A0A5C5GIG1_9RHOB|nr:SufD family Fe-S cluster assembly protein [Pelagovum pacificum]QQA44693.1 SufD family Fe-S cluster assembly protein [Pelagovum pacificum]TNY34290.1 Fe-S cluster assembly protein SufD [Pelagovum pacificum]